MADSLPDPDSLMKPERMMARPKRGFLQDCEYRIYKGVQTIPKEERGFGICKLMANGSGMEIGIDPATCSTCRLEGQINQAYIQGKVISQMRHVLHGIMLGRYDENNVELAMKLAYEAMGHMPTGRHLLRSYVKEYVRLNRLPLAKMEKLLTDHLPELLKDEPIPKGIEIRRNPAGRI